MHVAIAGSGYVGLITGACLADFGHSVVCFDKNIHRIHALQKGHPPFFEPGLEDLLKKAQNHSRLTATTDASKAIPLADVVFIAVGTPETPQGDADTSAVFEVVEEIAPLMKQGSFLVLKSTVPIGTNHHVCNTLQRLKRSDIQIISNPEFLREGAAIYDFMHPNRLIIGTSSEKATLTMKQLYAPLLKKGVSLQITDPETAETIKYAANSFLALKITFINQIANLCEKTGADIREVARGMGSDERIGPAFLAPGPGYGGSCFPKDTRALLAAAKKRDVDLSLIESAIRANDFQKQHMVQKICKALHSEVQGKTLGIWGLTFKAHTDDIRESPALDIVGHLLDRGALLNLFDPQAPAQLKDKLENATFMDDPYSVAIQADALIILTEWPLFQELDLSKIKKVMRTPLIIDLRNLLEKHDVMSQGLSYLGLGQGKVAAPKAKDTPASPFLKVKI